VQSPFSFEIDNLDCVIVSLTRVLMAWFSDTNCESKATYLAPAEIKREFYWVYFLYEFDKSELLPQSKVDMDRLVKEMQKFPEAKFEVSGYADERGSNEYNDKLSKRRAEAVKKALIEKGISADKLKIVAKGKRELQIKEAQDENQHAQNRRVEVRIINPENK
jgi:outer membrane protein OmpA-like peptidoglycan-associated protein